MRYYIFLIGLFFCCNIFSSAHALDASKDAKQMTKELAALNPVIVHVRPARIEEPSQQKYKIRWSPAVTLKKTSHNEEIRIAKDIANYVVRFQDGVLTDKVEGGVLAFFEGRNWQPEIGQTVYKVVDRQPLSVEVWTILKNGRADKKIGHIQNNRFIPQ